MAEIQEILKLLEKAIVTEEGDIVIPVYWKDAPREIIETLKESITILDRMDEEIRILETLDDNSMSSKIEYSIKMRLDDLKHLRHGVKK